MTIDDVLSLGWDVLQANEKGEYDPALGCSPEAARLENLALRKVLVAISLGQCQDCCPEDLAATAVRIGEEITFPRWWHPDPDKEPARA